MTVALRLELDPRIARALDELRDLISARYPSATFSTGPRDDPEGISLTAVVDVEDADEVVPVFLPRLVEMQVEEGLPVYVVPLETPERVAALLRRQRERRPQALP